MHDDLIFITQPQWVIFASKHSFYSDNIKNHKPGHDTIVYNFWLDDPYCPGTVCMNWYYYSVIVALGGVRPSFCGV